MERRSDMVGKYLLNQTEVLNKLSFSLSQLIDHLQEELEQFSIFNHFQCISKIHRQDCTSFHS